MLCVPLVFHLSLDTDFCKMLQEVVPLVCRRRSWHCDMYVKKKRRLLPAWWQRMHPKLKYTFLFTLH